VAYRSAPTRWGGIILRAGFLAAISLLLGACGSTATLRQGHEISEAGKTFATAMQTLADLSVESAIDESAAGLAESRSEAWGKFSSSTRLAADLAKQRGKLAELVFQIALFKTHSAKLEEYFVALGHLVDEPAKEAYVAATQELAASAGTLAATLQARNIVTSAHVTPVQQSALASLGGAVGQWYQAHSVKKVLQRDARTIDDQLVMQQKAIGYYIEIIVADKELEATAHYKKKVLGPYVSGYPAAPAPAPPLASEWRADFGTDVKTKLLVDKAVEANKAVEKLRAAWKDFTEGRWNTGDILGDLTRLRDGLEQVKKLHEGRH